MVFEFLLNNILCIGYQITSNPIFVINKQDKNAVIYFEIKKEVCVFNRNLGMNSTNKTLGHTPTHKANVKLIRTLPFYVTLLFNKIEFQYIGRSPRRYK